MKKNKAAVLVFIWFMLSFLFGWYAVGAIKSLQVLLFSFPFVLILLFPFSSNVRKTLFCLSLVIFGLSDFYLGIQAYLRDAYEASLNSGFVLESVANTSFSESKEYLMAMAPQIVLWSAVAFFIFLAQTYLAISLVKEAPLRSKYFYWFAGLIICLSLFGWYQRAWRAHFPPVSLLTFYQSCEEKKSYWKNIKAENNAALDRAAKHILSVEPGPRTIVLVVGESMNRENMSLYGYDRDTTPRLKEADKDFELHVSKEAFSTQSSTVAAFNDMFEFPDSSSISKAKLFAFFKAAGYKIYWISNQDDVAIKAEFQDFSNTAVNLNRVAGRSSTSMDEKVLPELEKALQTPSDKKLIVVHLIGIHPHFSFRYPSEMSSLWNDQDATRARLEEKGRSIRTLEMLEHYDRAMLYQDAVLFDTLKLTQNFDKNHPDVKTSWIFLSDHSVETGQRKDRTGHSNNSLGGYTIPFLFWTPYSDLSEGEEVQEGSSFRSDWLSYMLLDLAGIHCNFPIFEKSWLSKQYKWKEPKVVTDLKQKIED